MYNFRWNVIKCAYIHSINHVLFTTCYTDQV